MNTQWLLMKYHPAKKEVEFHRYQGDNEIVIRNDSKLMQYMNKKGKFVLQDHGNSFFNDISSAFDGLKNVEIRVITTKMDYEDFEQMVEYYNEESTGCQFTTTLLAELPDMAQTFNEVKKYGEKAIAILGAHQQKLFEIPLDNENVKRSAESFSEQIGDEINDIRAKIDSLSDNNVSLCFTGVYSAGKSALINAILGYRILPEAVTSETAKMFRIYSPKKNEVVSIKFLIKNVHTELEWNPNSQAFEFSGGPSESEIRTEIQKVLNEQKEKGEQQHTQIRNILAHLNDKSEISPEITVRFPVSLDTEVVQFTIYDTPGSDSNYLEHQTVLKEALAEQTQSILVFVIHPEKLEGEGNNALLNYLKDAENKSSKTSIDLGRSLFVVNHSDGKKAVDREQLRFKEIKNKDDESFSIKLADKKLLFVTAKFGYIAKAMMNDIATDEEKWDFEESCRGITSRSPQNANGPCYRQNNFATSERATVAMRTKCEEALDVACNEGDKIKELYICSGLYALETEITTYGEKYAAAVKAYAIIDSVDKALNKLNNRANSLKENTQKEISDINRNISELKNTIDTAILESYNSIMPTGQAIPEDTKKRLGVNREAIMQGLVGKTEIEIGKSLKGWFFGHGSVKVSYKHKEKVRDIVRNAMKQFSTEFVQNRKFLLEKQRDLFMKDIKTAISESGEIREEAKKWMLDIPKPEVPTHDMAEFINASYGNFINQRKVFFDTLDKNGFISKVKEQLMKEAASMSDTFCDDYKTSLETVLAQIKTQFERNLDDYSLNMKALKENKAAMEALGIKISDAADALRSCQVDLNNIIWKEINNV